MGVTSVAGFSGIQMDSLIAAAACAPALVELLVSIFFPISKTVKKLRNSGRGSGWLKNRG
jgi:hypothetical protein